MSKSNLVRKIKAPTRFIASVKDNISTTQVKTHRETAYLARAMVAIEIPVEPTVPSKMRDPV
jgi:hypothetical protein